MYHVPSQISINVGRVLVNHLPISEVKRTASRWPMHKILIKYSAIIYTPVKIY
jgi:hypothetical protein